jgi:hypothetical protein
LGGALLLLWMILGAATGLRDGAVPAAAAGAAVDATRGPGLLPVGHFGGSSLAVAATANRVYAGQGPVLAVYEPAGDGELRLLGRSAPLPGLITEIEVAGGLLAVAFADDMQDANDFDPGAGGNRGGLALLDVTDASRPRIRSVVDDLAALALGLGWAGGGGGDGEVAFARAKIDPMAGPEGAAPLGAVRIAGGGAPVMPAAGIGQMVLNPPWLALATEAGVISLDISDPVAPRPLGLYSPDGQSAWGLAYGRRLLYANTDAGLEVLEMADPSRPKLVGCGTNFGQVAARLEAAGAGFGAAASGFPRSARPAQAGGCQGGGFSGARLELASDKLYLNWFGDILFYDLRRPTGPELVGFAFTSSMLVDVVAGTRWLYSLGQDGRLEVMDLSLEEDFALSSVGQLDLPGVGARLSVIGNRAYAATSEGGLRVIDLTLPPAPREIGALIGAPHPRAIELASGRAYVVDGYSGLQIFDLADPARPNKLGAYSMPRAQALSLDGDRGYLLTENGELRAIDLSRPARPRELGTVGAVAQTASTSAMLAADGLLHLGQALTIEGEFGSSLVPGLAVMDASLPAAPRLLAGLDLSRIGGAAFLQRQAGRLYALGRSGLAIFDMADPSAPTALGTYYLPRGNPEITDLALAGDRAYLTLGATGLVVVDVSEPSNPVEVGVVPAGGRNMRSLAVDGDALYVVDRGEFDFEAPPDRLGISLLDLSVPNRARRLLRREGLAIGKLDRLVDDRFFFDGLAEAALARSGDYLYLADSRSGIQVFRRFEGPRVYLPALSH